MSVVKELRGERGENMYVCVLDPLTNLQHLTHTLSLLPLLLSPPPLPPQASITRSSLPDRLPSSLHNGNGPSSPIPDDHPAAQQADAAPDKKRTPQAADMLSLRTVAGVAGLDGLPHFLLPKEATRANRVPWYRRGKGPLKARGGSDEEDGGRGGPVRVIGAVREDEPPLPLDFDTTAPRMDGQKLSDPTLHDISYLLQRWGDRWSSERDHILAQRAAATPSYLDRLTPRTKARVKALVEEGAGPSPAPSSMEGGGGVAAGYGGGGDGDADAMAAAHASRVMRQLKGMPLDVFGAPVEA